MTFETVLERWQKAKRKSIRARIAYDKAHANALIAATGPVEVKKAQAIIDSANEREAAELAELDAAALQRTLDWMQRERNTEAA